MLTIRRSKKSKKAKTGNAVVAEHEKGSFLYHPEEEFFESVSVTALTQLPLTPSESIGLLHISFQDRCAA